MKDLPLTVRNTGTATLTVSLSGSLGAPYSFQGTSFPGTALSLAPGLKVASGIEIRMAEVTQLHIVLRQQHPSHGFATNDFLFPIF